MRCPVLVLTKASTIFCNIAPTTCLISQPATIPAGGWLKTKFHDWHEKKCMTRVIIHFVVAFM